jgi:hypothetical protein
MAARGAWAASGKASYHWIPGNGSGVRVGPLDCFLCPTASSTRLDGRAHGPCSRCRRRSARISSPCIGWTLDEPFFALRTCSRPVASSTCVHCRSHNSDVRLGLEAIDAQHVYVTGKQACDTFLTCDKGILRRAAGIKKIFPSLRLQRPSDLVASQEWSLAMTNHDDMPARFPALVWAVIFTILLVAAVAIFALVVIR